MLARMIGRHRAYWEPFCGSMAVLFAKKPCELETVNDLHGDLINLARVVRDDELGLKLYERLARTLCCEGFFRESKKRWLDKEEAFVVDSPDIDRAYDYFVVSWLGMNGVSGTERVNYQFALRWCVGGGQGAKRWSSVIESMPAWHKRLRNVLIIQRDGLGVIGNIKDERHTVIYNDPPYFEKSDKYVHDFTAADHKELADSLGRFERARVIVSYYDDEFWRRIGSKGPGTGTPDIGIRAKFMDWNADVTLKYYPDLISANSVVNILNTSGGCIGLGEDRPGKSGNTWGTFEVAT